VTAWLAQRAKAIVAVMTALLAALATVVGPDNPWIAVGLAGLGAFGVYFVENESVPEVTAQHRIDGPPAAEPDHAQHRLLEPDLGDPN
jgi:hypothetical protein